MRGFRTVSSITIPNVEVVLGGEVKPNGTGAHVGVPKKYVGRRVKVVVLAEDE